MKPLMILLLTLVALPLSNAFAVVYTVRPDGSGDFPTIQAAVDAAVDGDAIELGDGVFTGQGNRDVEVVGKRIAIRSVSGDPSRCTIDCQSMGRAFHFRGHLGSTLEGVTITGGQAEAGGAIHDETGDPALEATNCVFRGNAATGFGGAVVSVGGAFRRCSFIDNFAAEAGGGLGGGSGGMTCCSTLEECVFIGNSARYGAAAYLESIEFLREATIQNCTFAENVSLAFGGIVTIVCGSALIDHCTFAGNAAGRAVLECSWMSLVLRNSIIASSTSGYPVYCDATSTSLVCCDIYGNAGGDWVGCIADQADQNGNLSADPLFCNPAIQDYGLDAASPCAPGHNPDCGLIGAWPVQCGVVPVLPSSWGGIKWRYR